MSLPFPFDFKKPDYRMVAEWRLERRERLIRDPSLVPVFHKVYKENPIPFINDWGITFEPRNVDIGEPATIPFLLFPRQEEWIIWAYECWKGRTGGLTDKSRGVGVSWLAVAFAVWMCVFHDGTVVGFSSRKKEYVDSRNNPKALLVKARKFIQHLPREFRAGCDLRKDAPLMRIEFSATEALMEGEAGENIGRGGRTTLHFKDEAAYFENPEATEAALIETTNCCIDISTPRTRNDVFGQKRFSGQVPIFSFHYSDDPRKGKQWGELQKGKIDPIIFEIEYNLNYDAGINKTLLPRRWLESCIDAHIKLGIAPCGDRRSALDIGDDGDDNNAQASGRGMLLTDVEEWSGEQSDIFATTQRSFENCDMWAVKELVYDECGIGAGVRGDARVINEKRQVKIKVQGFDGSLSVLSPEEYVIGWDDGTYADEPKTNEDFFENRNSQAWWWLRYRVMMTHRAVMGAEFKEEDIISFKSDIPILDKMITELTQPVIVFSKKRNLFLVDKKPKGCKSPNLADAVKMYYAPKDASRSIFDLMAHEENN